MKDIKEMLVDYLRSLRKATVYTEQLERAAEGMPITYEEFAAAILVLEQSGLLEEIRSGGRNPRPPHVAYRYRIHVSSLRSGLQQRLHQLRLELHPSISLDRYFMLGESVLDSDLPFIMKIDRYLQTCGLPADSAAAPERSFALVGDEKWIKEKDGQALLERMGLLDKLKLNSSPDPVMFAVNPSRGIHPGHEESHVHLVVENKTTFLALLPALSETIFHTLIYGCGNKIVGNIDMFAQQYPAASGAHRFYYFGDIDYAGIHIWSSLSRKVPMIPALPFYRACLEKPAVPGKTNQWPAESALHQFGMFFASAERERMARNLTSGHYYPQETLSAQHLQQIGKEATWEPWEPLT
ncbi:Wadjet anti-phage system protein JetD domain-containing protein [Paenibacillus popilliae]|uniref:Transcriptional regulator n=1 Tax=Paenibacillus popilliae ATCC 14706 TaxID=1212764 RepID=M9M3G4_PAEPP|nr:Wadjet anti-phage system protein JetD domain-containing protein [Paenibacillus popilliae]GAC43559.1 transcriptional regulator [Paenibacillus popilliae ATCC 14706]